MAVLRDYQEDICTRVREALGKHRSVMMQMPTGTGKTVVLASLVREYLDVKDGCRVLIVAHRIELIEQMGEHLERYGIDYGVIAKGKNAREQKSVMVASIQTLNSKPGILCSMLSPSFIIIDEAHHAVAKTYRLLWEAWPEARFLGLTATPYRMNGEGFTDLFDVLVESWTVKRFIAEGWLSAFDYYSIRPESDEQRLIDSLKKRGADGDFQMKELHETLDVVPCIERLYESFERFASDKKGIIYAIDIAHAEHIAGYYRERGVNARALSSKNPMTERKEAVEVFKRTKPGALCSIQVLVSVDLFSEGFDCPDVEFIQLARPTLSLAKYLQMVGRGLRPNEGKKCCTIIDNVGLYRTFGLPSGEQDWGYYFMGRNLDLSLGGDVHLGLNVNNGTAGEEGDTVLVKIVGYEGMALRFANLGKEGFERKKKGKVWIWVDRLTGITFEGHPVVVDFKGMEMMTDDGMTFYPRIRSKWIDGKSGINRKALDTQVGDGLGWMKRYVSLCEPGKVYELQEVADNGMRVYKDEQGRVFFQQDLGSPLVGEDEAGGRMAFMAACEMKLKEWEERAGSTRLQFLTKRDSHEEWILPEDAVVEKEGEFCHICMGRKNFWADWNTGFIYQHRPIVRWRGFVKLVHDGDMVFIMNIHEERFVPYHNWEIRADDCICTIGNKLYLKDKKDGAALRIWKRSGDFQLFVVDEPLEQTYRGKPPFHVARIMIVNESGRKPEVKSMPASAYG